MKVNIPLLYSFLCVFLLLGCAKDEIDPAFTLSSEKEITLESDIDSKATVSFTSAREWQASTTSEWLRLSPASGEAGTYTLTITATSQNGTYEDRTATVTLTSLSLTQKITVKQEAADYAEPEQTNYSMTADGGALAIRFTTNVASDELSVYSSSVDWLTQSEDSRTADAYEVRLTVLPNTSASSRTAEMFFVKELGWQQLILNRITITQEGTAVSVSTDYSADKSVSTLQTATKGKGLPIVLMGDGFLDTEIADGTYTQTMKKAMENLFTEEPFKSLRNYFTVYEVKAVSKNNYFGKGYETAFSCELEGGTSTGISGDDDKVQEYVQCVSGIDTPNTLAIVILNSTSYAGTTYFGFSNTSGVTEFAIAYCPTIYNSDSESFRQVLVHEAVGHGFAKLEDEYSYTTMGSITSDAKKQIQALQAIGWGQNVDFTTDKEKVLWADLMADSRYTSENIGIYEGACTYTSGVYRSTKESMMNSNTTGFNAQSRRIIYNKVMKQSTGKEPDYEEFVTFDQQTQSSSRSVSRSSSTGTKPFHRPHFVNRSLRK